MWAPSSCVWAPWVSPVPFTNLECRDFDSPAFTPRNKGEWLPNSADPGRGLVINLRGEYSLGLSIELARRGWRPVPIFNASPPPVEEKSRQSKQIQNEIAALNIAPIRRLLCELAPTLAALPLSDSAPPAFLIDSERSTGHFHREPGMFDNRWKLYPQDFPSGVVLLQNGVSRVTLVQEEVNSYSDDMRQVLLKWQSEGIEIWEKSPSFSSKERQIKVRPLSSIQRLRSRIRNFLIDRRFDISGFGGTTSGGG
jgi:hypothetical protein